MRPLAVDVCADYGVQQISLEVFRNGSPSTREKTYDPVSCWDKSATLDAVPAGVTLFVRITGTGNQETWSGDSELFTLSPNEHKTLAPITLTNTAVPVPPAPIGLTASSGNGQLTLTWNSVSGATAYNLYRSTATVVSKATGTQIANVTSPYVDTGLTNGTTYYYYVKATNAAGVSPVLDRNPRTGAMTFTSGPGA